MVGTWAYGTLCIFHKDSRYRFQNFPISGVQFPGRGMATWTFPLEHVDCEETHISNVLVSQDDKTGEETQSEETTKDPSVQSKSIGLAVDAGTLRVDTQTQL